MINKLMSKYRTECLVIGVFLILLVVTYVPQVLSGLAFSYGYDVRQQYYPFFEEFRQQWYSLVNISSFPNILSGEIPFYSWNMFLGSNFFASKAYYTLGDLYNYVFLLFKNMHYYDIRFFQTLLKFTIAAISSFFYLRKFYKKPLALIVGTISYAFSFWIVYFIGQPVFISFYSLVPLYFLGMEYYLQDKKKLLFIVMTTILLCTNYYLFYTLSFFSVIYYTYRYYCLDKKQSTFFKETIILVGYYCVGVLMSMVLIYPAGLYILSNQRIGGMETAVNYTDIRIYFHMIQSFFSPNYMMDKSELVNVFSVANYRYDEIPLWSGILTTLLVPQILTDKDKRFKNATIVLYTFFIIMLFLPIGGSVLHGFSETSFRWLFFAVLMNIFCTARYLETFDNINIRNLKITGLVAIGANIIIIPLTAILTGQVSLFSRFLGQYGISLFFSVLLMMSIILILRKRRYSESGLIVLSMIAILTISSHYKEDPVPLESNRWEYVNRRSEGLQTENKELFNFLREKGEPIDEMYYRFIIDFDYLYGGYSYNSSIFYGINDLMTYDSTVSPSVYDLMKFSDADFFDQKWVINFRNPGLANFLSAKYAIGLDETVVLHKNFEFIGEYFGIPVYKNLDVVPFGSTYKSVVTYQELIDLNENTTSQLAQYVIVNDMQEKVTIQGYLESEKRSSMYNVNYKGNHLQGEIETDETTFMVLQLPYDSGWTILVNDEKKDVYRVNGGMMGVAIPKGYSKVEMYFIPKGVDEGVMLSGLGFILFMGIVIIEYRKNKKPRNHRG